MLEPFWFKFLISILKSYTNAVQWCTIMHLYKFYLDTRYQSCRSLAWLDQRSSPFYGSCNTGNGGLSSHSMYILDNLKLLVCRVLRLFRHPNRDGWLWMDLFIVYKWSQRLECCLFMVHVPSYWVLLPPLDGNNGFWCFCYLMGFLSDTYSPTLSLVWGSR